MRNNDPIQRVRIYLNERDSADGQPLYLTVLDRLRRAGATGATALRGVAGFGAGHRVSTGGVADLSRTLPIVIEWVDRTERVARLLPECDELLANALVTIEEVQIYRAVMRAAGPFGERSVGDVLTRDVATISLGATLREAARLLIERDQPLLPVLNGTGALVGAIVAADLAPAGTAPAEADYTSRPRLPLALPLLRALREDERRAALETLPDAPLTDLLTEPSVLTVDSPIPSAVRTLVEWGLEALPVIESEGRFAGLFGVAQALGAALRSEPHSTSRVRDAEPPAPVRLLMQGAVPTIGASVPAQEALRALLVAAERFLVVLDGGRPVGMLDDAYLIRHLPPALRAGWLAALSKPAGPLSLEPLTGALAADLPLAPALTIAASATRDTAIHTLLDQHLERLLVLDEDGRMIGLIGRRGLLRALAQETSS